MDFNIKFNRLLDKLVTSSPNIDCSIKLLQLLLKVIENIKNYPNEPKYKHIKTRGKSIQIILTNSNGQDCLIMMGFLKKVVDFEEIFVHVENQHVEEVQDNIKAFLNRLQTKPDIVNRKEEQEEYRKRILFDIEQDRLERLSKYQHQQHLNKS